MSRHISCCIVIALTVSTALAETQKPGELSEAMTPIVTRVEQPYLLYLPKDYDGEKSFPLMLFLHGAGERGNNLEKVKAHGPPKLIEAGKEMPFIVVAPQCAAEQWWDAKTLQGLLDFVETNYKVDTDRIYVTGLSMGGYGTWDLALRDDRFAAIAPICGGGNSVAARYTKSLKAPAWAFHGAKDKAVPIEESEKMVDVMKSQKIEAKLTVYPDAGHDSWTASYANDQLFEWLLSHRRSDRD